MLPDDEPACPSRITIDQIPGELYGAPDEVRKVSDRDLRRYRVNHFDFDARVNVLNVEVLDDWDPDIKAQWIDNKERLIAGLKYEFGEKNFDNKIQNFIDLGMAPISIISYHNAMYRQARSAFAFGCYYPALTSACALGERILNHLVLDLREDFRASSEYKKVYRKSSFDDWTLAIDTLASWRILLPEVIGEFRQLATLRHRSIHFNVETYANLRDDALTAVQRLGTIIGQQFGAFGQQPWFIEGVQGTSFIKRDYEDHPFIRKFYLRSCPFVGLLSSIEYDEHHVARPVDFNDYGDGSLCDSEFRDAYNARDVTALAKRDDPERDV